MEPTAPADFNGDKLNFRKAPESVFPAKKSARSTPRTEYTT